MKHCDLTLFVSGMLCIVCTEGTKSIMLIFLLLEHTHLIESGRLNATIMCSHIKPQLLRLDNNFYKFFLKNIWEWW